MAREKTLPLPSLGGREKRRGRKEYPTVGRGQKRVAWGTATQKEGRKCKDHEKTSKLAGEKERKKNRNAIWSNRGPQYENSTRGLRSNSRYWKAERANCKKEHDRSRDRWL